MQRDSAELSGFQGSPSASVIELNSVTVSENDIVENFPSFKREIISRPIKDRVSFLVSSLPSSGLCLHVGCCDAPLTEWSLKREINLHSLLLRKNPGLVGVDNSNTGLRVQKKAFPDAKFVYSNVEKLEDHFEPGTVDTILAGEILEHLSNPGLFLASSRKVLSESGKLVLTVPNVFGLRRLIHTVFAKENYHPDHVFYFSENTLRELARRHGFELQEVKYYPSPTHGSKIKAALYFFLETIPAKIFGNHYLDGISLVLRPRK